MKLPEPVVVSGRVMHLGKPVAGATIGFAAIGPELPAKHRYIAGTTDESGQYAIEKVYPTEYMVTISKPTVDVADPNDPTAAAPAATNDQKLAKYGNDSPLRAKVAEGTTSFDFELK